MIRGKTISSIVKAKLCTGCGTCVGVCPKGALEMTLDRRRGLYIPRVKEDKCKLCGLCFDTCPGHGVDFEQLSLEIFGTQPQDDLLGNHVNCYLGHATDYNIRYNAASGGLVTALLVFALESGIIDGALVTGMRKDRPLEPYPFIARSREEIISAARSKYCPVPANVALRDILKQKGRFAVVGLPCHIDGLRKAERANSELREKIVLHFGIVCSHTDSFRETEFILQKHGVVKDHVVQLDYRGHGWPGSMRIGLDDGTDKLIPFDDSVRFHQLYFFAPQRCTLCCDMICRLADISFMDAWLPEIKAEDKVGRSIVISRTEVGDTLCRKAMAEQVIVLQQIPESDVARSQGRMHLANRDLAAHSFLSRLRGASVPSYSIAVPRSGPRNYLRALFIRSNIWISSRRHLRRLVDPLASVESRGFRRAKSTM